MLRYEGLSVASAAQIAGISEGALKVRAFHAYEIIRAALAEHGALPPSVETTQNVSARRDPDASETATSSNRGAASAYGG
jgi:hypothetical protein